MKWAALFCLFPIALGASWTNADESRVVIPVKAQAIIDHLGMQKIPHEGPWFLQTHKSDDVIEGALGDRYDSPRYAYTAIYAVATRDEFSAMHRLATDEMWHFYGGNRSEILMLYPDGKGEIKSFGANVLAGEHPQILVPRGTWMGARPIGSRASAYTFAANTLSPGFEFEDYEIGYRDELTKLYPKFAKKIRELTREGSITRPESSTSSSRSAQLTPEIEFEELVGRGAAQRSDAISVARFTLQANTRTPKSVNNLSAEVVIIASGRGIVTVGDETISVRRGSVVNMPAKISHRVLAETRMELYAIVAPAYSSEDNTIVAD